MAYDNAGYTTGDGDVSNEARRLDKAHFGIIVRYRLFKSDHSQIA